MRKVVILTDSTADLSQEVLTEFEIESVPLYVRFGENIYRDGVDIDTPELYKIVAELGELPKTAAVSPGDFYEVFKKHIDQDADIIYIGIGSKLSATIQSANLAREEFPENRIFIVDSQNLSSGIALLVLKAKDFRNQGLGAQTIYDEIMKLVPRVRSQFAIRTLDYLYKGGRLSALSKLFGSILRVKPIIQVVDGKMFVYRKSMGKFSKAIDVMLHDYIENIDRIDLDYVMITHSIAPKQAKYMTNVVKNHLLPKQIVESSAGCVISSHCGEGTIGILYIMKED